MPLAVQDGAATPIALASRTPAMPSLPIEFISQAPYQNLCWAACCTMVTKAVHDFFPEQGSGLPVTLADVAREVIATGKCTPQGQMELDQPCWPDCAIFELINETCERLDKFMELELLCQEILDNLRPVMIYIEFNGGQVAHVVLLVGCDRQNGSFLVYDPKVGRCTKGYNELFSIDGGNWTRTFYRVGYSFRH